MIYNDGYDELSALGNTQMWCLKKAKVWNLTVRNTKLKNY